MAKPKKAGSFSFEASMERLEKIVAELESGDLTLEQSMNAFEEGVGLVKKCREFLEASRQRVEVLLGEEAGKPVIEVYEEDVKEEQED